MKKVSLVIPIFNKAEYLPQTLSKVEGFINHFKEIILVDDCSTDASLEIIKRFAKKYRNVHVIALPNNIGPFAARLAGINFSSADYIQLLDADDIIFNVGQLPEHAYDFSAFYFSNRFQKKKVYQNHIQLINGWPNSSAIIVNKKFAAQVYEPCRLSWGEDHVFFSQLLSFAPMLCVPGCIGEYVRHENTRGNRNASLTERFMCAKYIFQNKLGCRISSLCLAIAFLARSLMALLYKKLTSIKHIIT